MGACEARIASDRAIAMLLRLCEAAKHTQRRREIIVELSNLRALRDCAAAQALCVFVATEQSKNGPKRVVDLRRGGGQGRGLLCGVQRADEIALRKARLGQHEVGDRVLRRAVDGASRADE